MGWEKRIIVLACKIHKMSDATIVANVSMAIKW
jgi:hypothetical protein